MNRTLLFAGLAAAAVAATLAVYVSVNPFIPVDAAIERDVQSTQWGPLALTFPFFSWIGDAKGFVLEFAIFIAIVIFNRRAWLIAAGAAGSYGWYELINRLILRPRPTTAQVLQVTEHPGASSFPSGHTIFICTIVAVLVLCLGYRFVRGRGRVWLWAAGAAVVSLNAIDRIYTGTHWPSDVLAGILITTAWLCLWIALPPVYWRLSELSISLDRESSEQRRGRLPSPSTSRQAD